MPPSFLEQPVTVSMRPVQVLPIDCSLERIASIMRGQGADVSPIESGGRLVGVVTQSSLAHALARGCDPYDSVEVALVREFATIDAQETGAEALRRIADGAPSLLVLDSSDHVLGVVSALDLYPRPQPVPRPPLVGGMATPFGVYLTTGAIGAGASRWALLSTGAVMFILFALGAVVSDFAAKHAASYGLTAVPTSAWDYLTLAMLFVGMRILPLSGIHAAEHKVVHAIERGEPLVPDVVSRMPRVHPRCGTNLFAGSTIFVLVIQGLVELRVDLSLACIAAAVATLIFWRPFGNALQFLLTTKPPTKKQVEMGIRSGKELLEKYRLARSAPPTIIQRIWNSGLLHVLTGFVGTYGIAQGVLWILKVPAPF